MENKVTKVVSSDLTQKATLGSGGGTGVSRERRPVYRNLLPTCNNACPAGENIQSWLSHVTAGRYEDAWQELIRNNPMPAIHGRVCYHPCESSCNRAQLDGAVSIHAVERFLGDEALARGWTPRIDVAPTGKRVLVIGSGPSGLSCAYHLRRAGHEVVIYEASPLPGGMMRYGIPAYRLPRQVLDAEISNIERSGVRIRLNRKVDDVEKARSEGKFDAVFAAVGAQLSKRIDIPARDAGRILDAVGFLKAAESGETIQLGRRVTIYGGGNSAMDAARVAKRLGHEPMIVYRRDYTHMPAHAFEADEAREEGVVFHWMRSIHSLDQNSMQIEIMELDAEGRPKGTGRYETIESDDLILALGQESDTGFLSKVPGVAIASDGVVDVDFNMMTGSPGLFAGGDMVPSERSVTVGTGHGKKAARSIDSWLRKQTPHEKEKKPLASFEKLRLWFYTDIDRQTQAQAELAERQASFEEVVKGLSTEQAMYEAKRCLSCGNCFECDGCFAACPEDAIERLGPGMGYKVNLDKCTGCGICFEQCPCSAITMVSEPTDMSTRDAEGQP